MKKHIPAGLLVVLAALTASLMVWTAGLNVVAATNQLKLYLSPASASLTTGNSTNFQIRLNKQTTSKVDYVNAELKYPANLLEATSVSRSGSHFSANNGPSVSINNSTGVIVVNGQGASLGTPADVLVATVTFRAKAAGSASVAFTTNSQAGNLLGANNVKNYLDSTAGAIVTVTVPPQPSLPPTTTTTPPVTQTPSIPAPTSSPESTNLPTSDTATPAQTQTNNPSTNNPEQPSETTVTPTISSQHTLLSYWPWMLVGAVVVSAVVTGGLMIVQKRRQDSQPVLLDADIATDGAGEQLVSAGLPIQDDVNSAGGVFSSYQSVVEAEPTSQGEPTGNNVVPMIEGVAIEPLDAAMPSPLMSVADTSTMPVENTVVPEIPAQETNTSQQQMPVAVETAEQPYTLPAQEQQQYSQPLPEDPVAQPAPATQTQTMVAGESAQIISPEPSGGPDDIPDMFDIGAARLQAEGFAERLRPSATQ